MGAVLEKRRMMFLEIFKAQLTERVRTARKHRSTDKPVGMKSQYNVFKRGTWNQEGGMGLIYWGL
jgi:hypothetical protein